MSRPRTRPGAEGTVELELGGTPEVDEVDAVLREAFGTGAERVEVRVAADDVGALRALSRAGMRREGVVRVRGGSRVLMARLADDPEAGTPDAFFAMLNAGLPRKRVISQGLLHDPAGRVLLCELTYKREWDLPGGVVEPAESPAGGLVREVREELGVDLPVVGLRTVNWLPPWRQWDDACVFVFDLGVAEDPDAVVAAMTLQPTEIVAVHWCAPDEVARRAAAATATLLASLAADGGPGGGGGAGMYREAGAPPL